RQNTIQAASRRLPLHSRGTSPARCGRGFWILMKAFQHYDWDLASGLLSVIIEHWHHGGLLIEEPLALGTGCNRGFGFKAFAAEIDRRRRVGNQVVVPVRIARTTGVGCDEHDAIAVTRVDQRRRVSPSRASALGCEEQQRSAGELTSDFAVVGFELLDD